MKSKQIAKQMMVWFVGLIVIQVGVALFLSLNLGSDPFTLFTQGVARALAVSPGTANRLLTLIFLGVLFLLDRKQIKIGTFLCIIGAGIALDGVLKLLSPLALSSYSLSIKIIIFMMACVIVSIGFPILKSSEIGVAPNDLIYLALVKRLKKSYTIIRMSVDIIYMVLGMSLGGVIGIGTVLCVAFLGPLMDFFFPKIDHLVSGFLKEQGGADGQSQSGQM